jgi:hypothetical protein
VPRDDDTTSMRLVLGPRMRISCPLRTDINENEVSTVLLTLHLT